MDSLDQKSPNHRGFKLRGGFGSNAAVAGAVLVGPQTSGKPPLRQSELEGQLPALANSHIRTVVGAQVVDMPMSGFCNQTVAELRVLPAGDPDHFRLVRCRQFPLIP